MRLGNFTNFADNSKNYRRMHLLRGRYVSLTKSFAVGADPPHDPNPGMFRGIFATAS